MNNQESEEEFTEEEMRLGVKVFTALYWFTIFLLLLAIMIAIYSGFKGFLWYAVIPCWAALNFGLRVMKRYFRNIIEGIENDLEALAPLEAAEVSIEPIENEEVSKPKSIAHSSILVMTTMLTVSAFWYCIGLLLHKTF